MATVAELELKLSSFDGAERLVALKELKNLVPPGTASEAVNQHAHSFFSFNAYGYSPSRVAFEAYKAGLYSIGLVDFDTLDGAEEFLEACRLLGLRGTTGIESRVFVNEYTGRVINSPGEPGVLYFMGIGFTEREAKGNRGGEVIREFRSISRERNISRLNAVNLILKTEIGELDYEKDVLPLTPKLNATERHILEALDRKARAKFKGKYLIEFWAKKLHEKEGLVQSLVGKSPDLQALIRSKLFKQTGESSSYPALEDAIAAFIDLSSIPVFAWLDGTSDGEQDPEAILSLMQKKGVIGVNIIPDRNWNIKDQKQRELKIGKLREFIQIARKLGMPLVAGTEMNKFGQKITDNFSVPELKDYLPDFKEGACFFYGHTLLSKLDKKGFYSAWAKAKYPETGARIKFFTNIGKKYGPETVKEDIVEIKGS